MPFETFTAFVAEQAVGIAIGAIAVIAAPTIAPKLRDLGRGVAGSTLAATEKAGQVGGMVVASGRDAGGAVASKVAGSAIVPAVAVPAMQTGHEIYRRVSDGVQWYAEQWAGLVVEANATRAPRVAAASLTSRTVLAGLPRARVVSSVPGRVRLRVSRLQGRRDLAAQTAEELVTVPGIRHVYISSRTGSLLLRYDRRRYRSLDALLGAIAAW